ncbi:MAG: hypothetical protein IKO55_04405 [Kiritimatiellae bacterium]|nr:hypothetical protein [Kiritimatiellia bacterium]
MPYVIETVRSGEPWTQAASAPSILMWRSEVSGSLGFYEVKVDSSRFDAARLDEKIAAFFAKNPERRNLVRKSGLLSLADM